MERPGGVGENRIVERRRRPGEIERGSGPDHRERMARSGFRQLERGLKGASRLGDAVGEDVLAVQSIGL